MSSTENSDAPNERSWKLRSQILVSILTLATVIILTFSISLYVISLHATYRQAEADLLAAAQELLQQLREQPTPTALQVPELYRHRFGMAPRDHAYLALWDRNGNKLFTTSDLPAHAQPVARIPAVDGPHPFQTRATGRFLDLIVQTPQKGQLLIGRPLAKEWDGLIGLIMRLTLLSVLCLGGAMAIAIWLARRLSAPIDELAQMAHQITEYDFTQRLLISKKSSIEVAQLSKSLNELIARLHSALERQNRFIADASHELRTPVSVILSQAEHSLHRERDIGVYKESLGICLSAARRMKKLTDDLLFLAKADSHKLSLNREVVEIEKCAMQSIELLRPLAHSHAVQIVHDLQPVSVCGDQAQISQVFTNLISNAIRYNRPGGQVNVRTFAKELTAVIEIQDNGIGIPQTDHLRIFERFFQCDAARTQNAEAGSGLGLSLVHEIASAHGGTVNVQSMPDVGTLFTVSFVRISDDAPSRLTS